MNNYFSLQLTRTARLLKDFGMMPWLAYLLMATGFLLFSGLLFYKLSFAQYLYPVFVLPYIYRLGGSQRNDFLKQTFPTADYQKIRICENSLAVLPFIAYLLFEQAFLVAVALALVAIAFSFLKTGDRSSFVLPTPFSRRPFEFIAGFRRSWFVFIALYSLSYIAISVLNFNLGVFALICVFLVCISYYEQVEPTFYVWVTAMTPVAFLKDKIITAIGSTFILSLPILLALAVCFPEYIHILLIAELIGFGYVLMSCLRKYAYYPAGMSIGAAIIMGVSIVIPPLLFVAIPYFYKKSKRNLLLYK